MSHLIKRNNKIVKVHNNIIIPNTDVVKIGNQYWTAKNLAIYDGGSGIYIKNNVTANGVNFGNQYYYSYAAAVRVANSIPGWHLPTDNDFATLVSYIGGSNGKAYKLKSTTGWNDGENGTDEYGFNALPTGYLISTSLYQTGHSLYMRCADGEHYIAYISDNFFLRTNSTVYDSNFKFAVRLVKD